LCTIKNNGIQSNKNISAYKTYVSWLSYGDIKISDTFVYKYILILHVTPESSNKPRLTCS